MGRLPEDRESGDSGHIADSNQAYKKLNDLGPNVRTDYGADDTGATDCTTEFATAMSEAPSGGFVLVGPGIFSLDEIPGDGIGIIGAGSGATIIKARGSAAATLLDLSPSSPQRVEMRDFTLDLTDASSSDAMHVDNVNYGSRLADIQLIGGERGYVLTNTGHTYLERLAGRDQTDTALDVDGDNCGEVYYRDLALGRDTSGTLDCGMRIRRTTEDDVGGHYLQGVRITHPAGTVETGFKFDCSDADGAALVVFMEQCVADGCSVNAMDLQNVKIVRCIDGWLTTLGTTYAVRIAGGQDYIFLENFIDGGPSPSGSFDFHDNPLHVRVVANRLNQGISFFMSGDSADRPTNLSYWANDMAGSELTNSLGDLLLTQPSQTDFASWHTLVGGLGLIAESAAAVVPQEANVYRLTVDQLGTTPGTWRILGIGPSGAVTVLHDNLTP